MGPGSREANLRRDRPVRAGTRVACPHTGGGSSAVPGRRVCVHLRSNRSRRRRASRRRRSASPVAGSGAWHAPSGTTLAGAGPSRPRSARTPFARWPIRHQLIAGWGELTAEGRATHRALAPGAPRRRRDRSRGGRALRRARSSPAGPHGRQRRTSGPGAATSATGSRLGRLVTSCGCAAFSRAVRPARTTATLVGEQSGRFVHEAMTGRGAALARTGRPGGPVGGYAVSSPPCWTARSAAAKPILECVPSQKGLVVDPRSGTARSSGARCDIPCRRRLAPRPVP